MVWPDSTFEQLVEGAGLQLSGKEDGDGKRRRKKKREKNKKKKQKKKKKKKKIVVVCWLLNVPATCECISGTDLLKQFYVLPH